MKKVSSFFKKVFIAPIKMYQVILRPIFPSSCVFHANGSPGCSQYTIMAINKYGPIKGVYIGFKRILRCHPWQKNTYDSAP